MEDFNKNYGSNSHKSKEIQNKVPEHKVEQAVTTGAQLKKKSGFSKFKDTLLSDDSSSVKSYILNDVLIPSFKKAVSDIVTNGIDIILYGETRHANKSNNTSKISYTKYYNDRDTEIRRRSISSVHDCDDVLVSSRAEASKVLDALQNIIDQYGIASVADFYDIVGITDHNFTDNNYGWSNISAARVTPTRDGWLICMPSPSQIN